MREEVYKMKKITTLFLSLALCMGLAVPAFAASYEAHTFTADDATIIFDSVQISKTTVKLVEMEGDPVSSEVTMVTLKPGSAVTVKDNAGDGFVSLYGYVLGDDGVYSMTMADYELTTGTVDNAFVGKSGLIIELSGPDKIYLKLGEDSGTTTPAPAPEESAKPETPAESAQTTTPATPAASGTYTVKQGDTYGTIALNNYGTYSLWKQLNNANKGAKLVPGVQLTLPEKLGKTARIAVPVAGEGESLYTVKAGDTLGAIAKATYGNSSKYEEIYKRNSDRLKDANTIYAGQVIVLPAK